MRKVPDYLVVIVMIIPYGLTFAFAYTYKWAERALDRLTGRHS